MQTFCPISFKRIDENVARINAAIVVALLLLFFATQWIIVPIFVMVDFFIRGFIDSRYSPICSVAKWIRKTLSLPESPTNAGPKIFAAQIGTVLATLGVAGLIFTASIIPFYIIGVISFFALLETLFGICVACKIYPFLRIGLVN